MAHHPRSLGRGRRQVPPASTDKHISLTGVDQSRMGVCVGGHGNPVEKQIVARHRPCRARWKTESPGDVLPHERRQEDPYNRIDSHVNVKNRLSGTASDLRREKTEQEEGKKKIWRTYETAP